MNIQLTSDNIEVTESMKILAEQKIKKLEPRLSDMAEDLQNIRVVLNTGPGDDEFNSKIEFYYNGKELFAKEVNYSIESALISAVEAIERQLNKEKTKETENWEEKRDTKWFDETNE